MQDIKNKISVVCMGKWQNYSLSENETTMNKEAGRNLRYHRCMIIFHMAIFLFSFQNAKL